jgi:hypothetical protein
MKWETSIPDVMFKFFSTFIIKNAHTHTHIGYKYKVYVISNQLIVDVFKVDAKGYVGDPKGQVNKTIIFQALQVVKLNPQILLEISGM